MRVRMTSSFVAVMLCLFAFGGRAEGQTDEETDEPKFEAGVHFSVLPVDDDPTDDALGDAFGTFVYKSVGVRFTYNLNDNVALDSELNFFPHENERRVSRLAGGWPVQGLFGVKAGKRFERVGVFGKVRPGFLSFSETVSSGLGGLGPAFSRRTHFNVDVGGVVELYPSRQVVVRVDAGDTIIRYGEENLPGAPAPLAHESPTHNFQFSAGVGYRF